MIDKHLSRLAWLVTAAGLALPAVVFYVLVVVLPVVFTQMTGSNSPAAVILSPLASAAL